MSDKNSKNSYDVSDYLPHQFPMLMVDTIQEITKESVETRFAILVDNVFLNNDYFQECGLIENAAQTCSAIVGQSYFLGSDSSDFEKPNVVGFISAIKKIEIFKLPKVNSVLKSIAHLESSFEGLNYTICSMNVEIVHNNELILKGSMNLFLQKM